MLSEQNGAYGGHLDTFFPCHQRARGVTEAHPPCKRVVAVRIRAGPCPGSGPSGESRRVRLIPATEKGARKTWDDERAVDL